ncbi:MAG: A/G-specific adenine glycosylase [Bacteroidales bacterium]|nr:A/G-specific adenine glycosylase [Bacteroidales bacterium]
MKTNIIMKEEKLFYSIIKWFRTNKRNFLWRQTMNPYHQLVAEFVFQQTRIEQGMPYYLRIIDKYPTIKELSEAHEDDFLKDWQGLGYYQRAHRLLKLAQIIMDEYNGQIPSKHELLKKLPGIGPYMAAILSSQWSSEKIPAIDGNVRRIMARILGIQIPIHKNEYTKKIQSILQKNIVHFPPGEFNEALMELGATICLPKRPLCQKCPIHAHCFAYIHSMIHHLPMRNTSKIKKQVKLFYLVHCQENYTYVRKRKSSLWHGLYEFPIIEKQKEKKLSKNIFVVQHELTHRKILAYFVTNVNKDPETDWIKIHVNDLPGLPVHVLMHKFLTSSAFKKFVSQCQ